MTVGREDQLWKMSDVLSVQYDFAEELQCVLSETERQRCRRVPLKFGCCDDESYKGWKLGVAS